MTTSVFFFFLLASSALKAQGVLIDKNDPLAMRCKQESNITQEILDGYADDPEKEPTEEYYCYLRCVLQGAGFLNEVGEIQIEFYKSKFIAGADCLEEIPNVAKCTDMEAFLNCINK